MSTETETKAVREMTTVSAAQKREFLDIYPIMTRDEAIKKCSHLRFVGDVDQPETVAQVLQTEVHPEAKVDELSASSAAVLTRLFKQWNKLNSRISDAMLLDIAVREAELSINTIESSLNMNKERLKQLRQTFQQEARTEDENKRLEYEPILVQQITEEEVQLARARQFLVDLKIHIEKTEERLAQQKVEDNQDKQEEEDAKAKIKTEHGSDRLDEKQDSTDIYSRLEAGVQALGNGGPKLVIEPSVPISKNNPISQDVVDEILRDVKDSDMQHAPVTAFAKLNLKPPCPIDLDKMQAEWESWSISNPPPEAVRQDLVDQHDTAATIIRLNEVDPDIYVDNEQDELRQARINLPILQSLIKAFDHQVKKYAQVHAAPAEGETGEPTRGNVGVEADVQVFDEATANLPNARELRQEFDRKNGIQVKDGEDFSSTHTDDAGTGIMIVTEKQVVYERTANGSVRIDPKFSSGTFIIPGKPAFGPSMEPFLPFATTHERAAPVTPASL